MHEIGRYPVQPDEYTKEEAPYLYTDHAGRGVDFPALCVALIFPYFFPLAAA